MDQYAAAWWLEWYDSHKDELEKWGNRCKKDHSLKAQRPSPKFWIEAVRPLSPHVLARTDTAQCVVCVINIMPRVCMSTA